MFCASASVTHASTIMAWGYNDYGQTNVPSDLTNAIEIATWMDHSLALRDDGTVVAWGYNDYGQADVPAGIGDVMAIACGWTHSLALRTDGTVVGWGSSYGSNVPSDLSNVVAIAAGGQQFSLALRSDRTVAAWGYNGSGQTDVPAGLSNIVAISAGMDHCLALRDDGSVLAWGENFHGASHVPEGLSNVVAIAAGWAFSLALQSDGTVVGWGGDYSGKVQTLANNAVAISAGGGSKLAMFSNGAVLWSWVAGLNNVSSIAAGHFHGLALVEIGKPKITSDNLLDSSLPAGASAFYTVKARGSYPMSYQWQFDGADIPVANNSFLRVRDVQATASGAYSVIVSNISGSITSKVAQLVVEPAAPRIIVEPADVTLWPGSSWTLRVTAWGTASRACQWRFNGVDLPDAISTSLDLTAVQPSQAGGYDAVISNASGSVTSRVARVTISPVAVWGDDESGMNFVPARTSNAVAVAAGGRFNLAWSAGGDPAVNWGADYYGFSNSLATITDFVTLAAGGQHLLALRKNGSVQAYGYNGSGETNVPASLDDAISVSAGWDFSLALRSDGTVLAWGADGEGQRDIPGDLNNVVAIAAGGRHALALRADGTVVSWGSDITPEPYLSNIVAVAAGSFHNLALQGDGTVKAWGWNGNGQTTVPLGLSNVLAIAAGRNHNLALRSDGTIIAWGDDGHGQTDVPTGLSNVVAIAVNEDHNLALMAEAFRSAVIPLNSVRDANGFSVSVATKIGKTYSFEYKDTLSDRQWTTLFLSSGNGQVRTLTDSNPPISQRFYRIRQW